MRPATNADGEQIRDLVYGVLAEYGLKHDPASTDADLDDIERFYGGSGGVFHVLEAGDGSIVGSYGLYPLGGRTCELRKMYLRRSYRGRGHGKRMLDEAIEKARQLGFERIVLETASVLIEAIRLYESYGFVVYRPDHLSARCDQAYALQLH